MASPENESERTSGRRPKVARLLDEYGRDALGAELERLWTADTDERRSLRDLADYFNEELLATAMSEAGLQTLDGESENVYRLLTADDVSDADRQRTRRQLEREGVDVDALLDDFVTYQAIRTYLKEHRGAEYSRSDEDRTAVEKTNIQRLRGRITAVTEGKFEQLRDGGHLSLGDFRVLVDVAVVCEDCGTQYEASELLDRGACDCGPTED
ncbi:MAG: rod-determining factor RdfA [Haloferacaceae archaeon]